MIFYVLCSTFHQNVLTPTKISITVMTFFNVLMCCADQSMWFIAAGSNLHALVILLFRK